LPAPPSNLQRTVLGTAEVIGMEPSGALDGIRSSGLTRHFRLKGVGVISFNEENYRAAGGSIEVIEESLNTQVNGTRARLERRIDDQGRACATLSWPLGGKAFRLTATGNADVEHQARVLQEIAAAITD